MLLSGYQLGKDGRKGKEKDREGREGEGRRVECRKSM